MKLPISKRLLLCADLVPPCETAADVGTDHGYLAIRLLQAGICRHVIAADLREKPLATARANAELFGFADRMTFLRSDGLHNVNPGSFQTLICAGMGGDLITRILSEAPWLQDPAYTLILQAQSGGADLRRWLGENRFSVDRECLVRDGGFLYGVMLVRWGQGRPLTPGEQYVSPALRRENDPLYSAYLDRIRNALERTVAGITRSADPADLARADYYRTAFEEISALGYAPEPSPAKESAAAAHTGEG